MPRSKERELSSKSAGVQELAPRTLGPEVQDILRQTEEVSGRRIRVVRDPTLPTWAAVRVAKSEAAAHTIRYAPRQEAHLGYLIAHECGHLLRLWSVPPEARMMPCIGKEQRETAQHRLRQELPALIRYLPEAAQRSLLRLWHEGIVRQVSTYPADVRIEEWMFEQLPEMRSSQRAALVRQLKENELVLVPRVESITSQSVYRASVAMNCAFAHFAAALLQEPSLSGPYPDQARQKARKLFWELHCERESGNLGDVAVSKRWSEVLDLSGWFKWIRLDATSEMNVSFI